MVGKGKEVIIKKIIKRKLVGVFNAKKILLLNIGMNVVKTTTIFIRNIQMVGK